ncbi:MAG: hypothetical protein GY869_19370 [Planctomycetes bacterium]|nr:hypothetical protein [Planctomycetota bacterium]
MKQWKLKIGGFIFLLVGWQLFCLLGANYIATYHDIEFKSAYLICFFSTDILLLFICIYWLSKEWDKKGHKTEIKIIPD